MSPEISEKFGETTAVYTTCQCNCGGNQHCVIKAHVKNGKVVAAEPDDRYNKNAGREDSVLSAQDLIKNRLQRRPCTMGRAFHRYLYHPERISYPLKRSPGTERGKRKYTRISWEEACFQLHHRPDYRPGWRTLSQALGFQLGHMTEKASRRGGLLFFDRWL